MTDIAAFLNARLDEDEALAKLQAPWPWHVGDEPTEVFAEDGIEVATAFALSGNQQRNTAAFIARHDPARVLREVEAKRAIVKFCDDDPFFLDGGWVYTDRVLHLLAAAYADHPDYDPAWTVAT